MVKDAIITDAKKNVTFGGADFFSRDLHAFWRPFLVKMHQQWCDHPENLFCSIFLLCMHYKLQLTRRWIGPLLSELPSYISLTYLYYSLSLSLSHTHTHTHTHKQTHRQANSHLHIHINHHTNTRVRTHTQRYTHKNIYIVVTEFQLLIIYVLIV